MKKQRLNENNEIVHSTISALLVKGDEILLIQKADPKYAKKWSIVAGHVEEGEEIECAFLREIEEEIGIKLNRNDYHKSFFFENLDDQCRYDQVKKHDWHVFSVTKDIEIDQLTIDKDEIIQMKWFKLKDLPKFKEKLTSGAFSLFKKLEYI